MSQGGTCWVTPEQPSGMRRVFICAQNACARSGAAGLLSAFAGECKRVVGEILLSHENEPERCHYTGIGCLLSNRTVFPGALRRDAGRCS